MRRVFLHVGAPKTGTTYLQDLVGRNRALLHDHGVHYPDSYSGNHFEAAIDLLQLRWGGRLKKAVGAWDDLARQAERGTGDVLVSHEVLAAATAEQAARARAAFADAEVHLVLTARDLGRQIPAEWQETVKHRGRRSFRSFVKDLRKHSRTDSTLWFWRVQALPDVVERWSGGAIPSERVHVVTVPPSGSDPTLLWRRFASVLGLPEDLPVEQPARANESMGVAETALVRRLNLRLKGHSIPQPVYAAVVRERIVHDTLAGRWLSPRASVPPTSRAFFDRVTAQWQQWLIDSGIDLVGDPDDLTNRWPDDRDHWEDPDAPDPDAVIDAAVEALARLVEDRTAEYRRTGPVRRLIQKRLGR